MITIVINESGYDEALLGFSLSYNTSLRRAEELLPAYAFKQGGENKFLESIDVWLDVAAPRYWWQEADTYRVGTTKQSESTMHAICKRKLNNDSFENPILTTTVEYLNSLIYTYCNTNIVEEKQAAFLQIKNALPEGFLQRRIWKLSYKNLQNIYFQRKSHRLPQWHYFINEVLKQIQHPEFIKPLDM